MPSSAFFEFFSRFILEWTTWDPFLSSLFYDSTGNVVMASMHSQIYIWYQDTFLPSNFANPFHRTILSLHICLQKFFTSFTISFLAPENWGGSQKQDLFRKWLSISGWYVALYSTLVFLSLVAMDSARLRAAPEGGFYKRICSQEKLPSTCCWMDAANIKSIEKTTHSNNFDVKTYQRENSNWKWKNRHDKKHQNKKIVIKIKKNLKHWFWKNSMRRNYYLIKY